MTTTDIQLDYKAEIVPGLLELRSNRPKIPNFGLASTVLERASQTSAVTTPNLKVGYIVRNKQLRTQASKGKSYRCHGPRECTIELPFGRFLKLVGNYSYDERFPTIEVNSTYHRLGRITIGNMHSVGWLMRDLCNIHLLLKHYALVHAAGLQNRDRCVALVGLSNTGKSTTAFDLTLNGPCNIYGDDLVVTDGKHLFACPYTRISIPPRKFPQLQQRVSQWASRKIPFYENFGPSTTPCLQSYVGSRKIAQPSVLTDLVFLRNAESHSISKLERTTAAELLSSSNRTEFTFMNSALFSAYDYLNDRNDLSLALSNEHHIYDELSSNTNCWLIKGDISFFRQAVGDFLSVQR